jgi:hypothetical protein
VPAQAWLGEDGPLCDSCFDERISAATGWPRLPAPPAPVVVAGADRRQHRLRFRLWRTPGGISAEAIEESPDGDGDEGLHLRVFGEHDADPAVLLAELHERVRAEVGRRYLERDRGCWQVAGSEVAGRVGWGAGGPPDVVVDGRRFSWEEFGQAVASFEGWWFRITFGDDYTPPPSDPRPVAAVVPLRPRP